MPGPGGGGRGGGGSRGGFSGGGGGFGGGGRGGFGGGPRGPRGPHYHHHRPFFGGFWGPRYYGGGGCLGGAMALLFVPILIILVAVMMVFSVLTSAFNTVISGGEVKYNEEAYQDFANETYYQEFGASAAFEDNILLVFLVEEDYYDYNFIAWVGDDIKTEINYMFGSNNSELGRAIQKSAINSENYKYSMGQGITSVVESMGNAVAALELDSSFKCDENHIGVDSVVRNYTDLQINESSVNEALAEFTAKTGIPIVVVVEYQEDVFGKTISAVDILIVIVAVALIALAVVLIVKAAKAAKANGGTSDGNGGNNQSGGERINFDNDFK